MASGCLDSLVLLPLQRPLQIRLVVGTFSTTVAHVLPRSSAQPSATAAESVSRLVQCLLTFPSISLLAFSMFMHVSFILCMFALAASFVFIYGSLAISQALPATLSCLTFRWCWRRGWSVWPFRRHEDRITVFLAFWGSPMTHSYSYWQLFLMCEDVLLAINCCKMLRSFAFWLAGMQPDLHGLRDWNSRSTFFGSTEKAIEVGGQGEGQHWDIWKQAWFGMLILLPKTWDPISWKWVFGILHCCTMVRLTFD